MLTILAQNRQSVALTVYKVDWNQARLLSISFFLARSCIVIKYVRKRGDTRAARILFTAIILKRDR